MNDLMVEKIKELTVARYLTLSTLLCFFLCNLSIFGITVHMLLYPIIELNDLKPHRTLMLLLCIIGFVLVMFGAYAVFNCCYVIMAMVASLLFGALLIGIVGHIVIKCSPIENFGDPNIVQLLEKYKESEETKKFWDSKQESLKCCGVYEPQDWIKRNIMIPYSCCHAYNKEFHSDPISIYCKFNADGKLYLYQTGCFSKTPEQGAEITPLLVLIYFTYLIHVSFNE